MLNIETFFNTKDVKRFFFPGKIFWGKDCRNYLPELIEPDKTIALFVDIAFARSDFIETLRQRFIKQIVCMEEIESMPKTENVRRIIAKLGKVPDIVISIGGGSTIDTAKAVTAGFIYGSFEGAGVGERRGIPTLDGIVNPVFICLPTTAGTGSEASRYYVVYDSETHLKLFGRSWELTADWILLDASFVRNSPDRLLINSAFDAFIHCFESYLCKYERSWFGDMLSLDGMVRIISSLDRIIHHKERNDDYFLRLLYASTIAGVAVSNVRTGVIHEAAGALLEHAELTHPETLFVFMRAVCEQYAGHIGDRMTMLLQRINAEYQQPRFGSLEAVIDWWENLFAISGITNNITAAMKRIDTPQEMLKKAIFNRVYEDKVWNEKESPLLLDESLINGLIDSSLARFGLGLT